MPSRRKPTKGQISLIGEIYRFELKHQPHIEAGNMGDKVVVVRVPEKATTVERVLALEEAAKLARTVKTNRPDYTRRRRRK